MKDIKAKDTNYNFLIEEYKKCWDYIQFNYEQRDKSQRFYFIFVLSATSIVTALLKLQPENLEDYQLYILLLFIVPVFFIGILFLGQLIALRKTTTLYHKNIVLIRSQLLGNYETELYIRIDKLTYFNIGFNFFSALIVMIITGFVLANVVLIIFLIIGVRCILHLLLISILVWIASVLIQYFIYFKSLEKKDKNYVPRFTKSEITN